MQKIWMIGLATVVAGAFVGRLVFAQGGASEAPEQTLSPGIMRLETTLGSFSLPKGKGRIEMNFRGTILLSDYKGADPVFEGNIRKEYEGHGRMVWFGKGKVTLDGEWRNFQWFGGDLNMVWRGIGIARLYGEFDPQTGMAGTVQVDDEPAKPWYTTGTIHYVPKELNPAWETIKRNREQGLPDEPQQPARQGAVPVEPLTDSPGHEGHGH